MDVTERLLGRDVSMRGVDIVKTVNKCNDLRQLRKPMFIIYAYYVLGGVGGGVILSQYSSQNIRYHDIVNCLMR